MRKANRIIVAVLAGMCLVGFVSTSRAQQTDPQKVQPYIETLKQRYGISEQAAAPPQPEAPTPAELKPRRPALPSDDPRVVQPYIQALKDASEGKTPEKEPEPQPNPRSRTSEGVQPYIESVKRGRELEPKYNKTVRNAGGISVVTFNRFKVTSKSLQANSFDNVYNTDGNYALGFDVFFEHELMHNPYSGSFGLVAHAGFIMPSGRGIFRANQQPSDVGFRFMVFPVSVGAGYRLSQLKYITPYGQVLAIGIPFSETRTDGHDARNGISRGVQGIAGVAINLDWLFKKSAWEIYGSSGVLHTYLTFQMDFIRSIASNVAFNYDGGYAGFMFEY